MIKTSNEINVLFLALKLMEIKTWPNYCDALLISIKFSQNHRARLRYNMNSSLHKSKSMICHYLRTKTKGFSLSMKFTSLTILLTFGIRNELLSCPPRESSSDNLHSHATRPCKYILHITTQGTVTFT